MLKPDIIPMARRILKSFEFLKQALLMYLEAKRVFFPRLYFLSNEQIIELVTMVDDVFMLQRNMFKMFDGVAELKLIYRGSIKSRVEEATEIKEKKKNSIYPYTSTGMKKEQSNRDEPANEKEALLNAYVLKQR